MVKRSLPTRSPCTHPPVPRLLNGIAIFFLALAVTLRPILPGHRDEANLWVQMCVFLAALAGLVRGAMARKLRAERTGLGLPIAALLALAAASTWRSAHPRASLVMLLEWLAYAAAFATLVAATAGPNGIGRQFFLCILWASAFVAFAYGLFQQFVNLPLLRRMIAVDPDRVLAELHMSSRHIGELMARATGRIFSTFLVSNSFAGFIALVFPGFLGHVLDRLLAGGRRGAFLAASGLWLAAALACLLLTYSKGGWVAFGLGMAAFAAMLGKGVLVRHARLAIGTAAAALAAFGLLLAIGIVPTQIFRDIATSQNVRLGYWRGALDMARGHPLGGVGLATFGDHYPRYRPLLAHPAQDAHNAYLQVLAELGVPGLAAFLWLWAAWLRNALRKPGQPPPHPEPRTPNPEPRSSPLFPRWLGYAAAIAAFVLTTAITATFSLAGWWDAGPERLALKAWLDTGLAIAFAACWLLFFAALGRPEGAELGELCRKGLACGVIAFLVHCAVDFDYQEPGVAFTAWVVVALSVRPVRAPAEWRPRPLAAAALAAGALALMFAFQAVLWRVTRAATSSELAAGRLSEAADAARAASPLRRGELIRQANELYGEALRADPLDAALRVKAADLLVSFLVPPEPAAPASPAERSPGSPDFRLRLNTPADAQLFAEAAALYARAAELNRAWAAPHARLGGLYAAAARPDAGPAAQAILEPLIAAARQRRPPSGPNLSHLPALAAFEDALARDPHNPALLLLVAEARERHGDPAALEAARRALEIDTLLHRADPGHKVRLRPSESERLHSLLRRIEQP